MQSIRLLTIGSLKAPWIREGCEEFAKRIQPLAKLEILELPASKSKDVTQQIKEESEKLLDTFGKEDVLVILDERGEEMTTQKFASFLSDKRDRGMSITFAIGGAYGLDDRVRGQADLVLALSELTYPHELCRLVFLEALYRGLDVGRGGKYHH